MPPEPNPSPMALTGAPSWMAPLEPSVPDHELVRRIGGGSYGDVWLARTVLGTWRAVKVVFRDRFLDARPYEREFSAIRRFEPLSRGNEGFIDILQIGRNDEVGYFYYVMELADEASGARLQANPSPSDRVADIPVSGDALIAGTPGQTDAPTSAPCAVTPEAYVPKTLAKVLSQRKRLPVKECLELGLSLNLGLARLHAAGLIHRDIKPSNIIFVEGAPKLADIGLVIEAAEARSYVGTEGFIPPEGPNSPQADLFSFGKVLYEAGMGKDRKDFPEPLTEIGDTPDSDELVEFNAILLKACAANVKDRYRSAEEMNADLALLRSGGSVVRQRAVSRKLRFVQRAGAAVTALAALILAGLLYQARQTRIVGRLADEKTQLATERTKLAGENRERLVRLNIANGVRELDQRGFGSALVWLSEALSLATNNPADAAINRVRINQLLGLHPRILNVFPHPTSVRSAGFDPNDRRIVTGCRDGTIRIWDTVDDQRPVAEFQQPGPILEARFMPDGRSLFVVFTDQHDRPAGTAILDAVTGRPVFPTITNVTTSALSPDGRRLAVGRTDFHIEIIATSTGEVIAEAIGHKDRVEMVSFESSSSQFVSASRDGTARIWDAATGKQLGVPLKHNQPVLRAMFNRDRTRIATAEFTEDSTGGVIQFHTWDVSSRTTLEKPALGIGAAFILAFDVSGRRLLTADREPVARVWDADSHVPLLPSLAMDSSGDSFDFSPDGATVAVGSRAGGTWIWDLETGRPVLSPLRSSGKTESVRFNGDGSRLLIASDDGAVKLWDLVLDDASRSLSIPSYLRPSAAVSPDGKYLLMGIQDVPSRLLLVNLETLEEALPPPPFSGNIPPSVLTFDQSGNCWAAVGGPLDAHHFLGDLSGIASTAGLWRREGGGILHFGLPHSARVRRVVFQADASRLLTVSDDSASRIWSTVDGSLQQTIRHPESDLAWVAVSPDLRTAVALVMGTNGCHMVLRDVQTGKAPADSPEDNPDINVATFSPDGRRVATAGDNQSGRIWDSRSGKPLTPFFRHGGALTCIEWSPDGRRVLTAGLAPDVKVWDAATGEMVLGPLVMKTKPVESAGFSADGRYIVARSDEDLVRVWDAATGEAVTPLLPHDVTVRAAFVTAAQQLVTVVNSGVIRVWNLKPTTLPARDVSDYAWLLAGRPMGGGLAGAKELANRLRSLRARQPGLFETPHDHLRLWHQREAQGPDSISRAEAAIFHLGRLGALAPGDTSLQERLGNCKAVLIPDRSPGTPERLIDLSRIYTHSLDLLPNGEFARLPRGRQALGGTEFDIRGMAQLNHRSESAAQTGPFHSLEIIPVRQRCRELHFLQAAEGELGVDGSAVARWIIHYADGAAHEWPVIYGDHLRNWRWGNETQEPLEARKAAVVWRGRPQVGDLPGTGGVRLFKATWTNPRPEVEISKLEYRIGETAWKPFVIAITAE